MVCQIKKVTNMNAEKLKDLAKLLDFGADCLEKQKINLQKIRGARKVFFPMVAAAQSFTESILTLCKEDRTPACLSLLRSLCENLIKAKFLYCHPLKHSHLIFFDGLMQKRKQLNHAIQFLKTNQEYLPHANFTMEELTTAQKRVEIQEKRVKLK